MDRLKRLHDGIFARLEKSKAAYKRYDEKLDEFYLCFWKAVASNAAMIDIDAAIAEASK